VDKMIVIGGGGHAKVLMTVLKKSGRYQILGYTDPKDHGSLLNFPYLGDDSVLAQHKDAALAFGIGCVDLTSPRSAILKKLFSLNHSMPAILSKDAVINEGVQIGKASVVYDGAVIQTGTKIGEGVIINSRASIDHDCVIGSFTHIAPGVTMSGNVQVGENSLIGVGSTLLQAVKIGSNVLIAAGSTVLTDCLEAGTYMGYPAKKVR
jgi:sugar O-acyltransferase (sialic acid O-acetyltransferase NeuD family)